MFLKLLFCVDTYYMPCEYYHILKTLFIKIWVSTFITQYIPGYVILYYRQDISAQIEPSSGRQNTWNLFRDV